MENMEKKRCYGVLFDVVYFHSDVAVFLPQRLIEGVLEYDEELEQQYFLDDFYNEYLEMHELAIIEQGLSQVVGYVISEEEFMKKYSKSLFQTLQEKKNDYYRQLIRQAHFGFRVISEEQEMIQMVEVDFTKFVDCFIRFPELLNTKDSISSKKILEMMQSSFEIIDSSENMTDQTENAEGVVIFTKEEMEELLAIEDGNTVKEKIQDAYYHLINALQKHLHQSDFQANYFESEEVVSEEDIRRFFDCYYKKNFEIDNLLEFQEILQYFCHNLEKLLTFLNTFSAQKSYSFDDEFIYRMFIVVEEVMKLENLDVAKSRISTLFQEESKNISNLVFQYIQLLEKESCNKEIDILDQKLNAKDMKNYLDKVVIGQDTAKKKVISTIIRNALTDDSLTKNTCLLIGPTGCGKTLLVRTIGKYLDKPIVFIDSTQLTMQGYKGHDLEEFLIRLLDSAKGDQKKAEEGMVVFDEIDKKATNGGLELDGFSKGVMDMLLSFIEGTTYDFYYRGRTISFDTSKLIVFATGSFEEMVKQMKQRKSQGYTGSKIGFQVASSIEIEENYPTIQPDDLGKYGNVPSELIGRISTIVQLDAMTKNTMIDILTSSERSVLLSEKRVFQKLNVNLQWTYGYLEKIAERALSTKTGARALKRFVEESVEEARLEANAAYFEGRRYESIILHEETVLDSLNVEFIDSEGNSSFLRDIRNSENEQDILKKVKKI